MKTLSRFLRTILWMFVIADLVICGYGIYSLFTGGERSYLIVSAIFLPLFLKLIYSLRSVEYDEYGLDSKGRHKRHISASEQREMDMQQIYDMERVLSSDAIKKMTHQGSKNPDKDLGSLVGLESVRKRVMEMAARMELGIRTASSKHLCFLGNPGTGKTTVARIITGYLYKYKYIKKNHVIEIDGNFLKASNPTDTALKTELVVRASMGGVLFIDEAYALIEDGTGIGDAAVATLIKQMEDKKDSFILILAGYTEPVKSLLDSNPGFRSRIKDYLIFPDYTNDELFDIFCNMARMYKFSVSEDAYENFLIRIDKEKRLDSFGNARTVRNILDETIDTHALRYKRGEDCDKFVISPDDISKNILVI